MMINFRASQFLFYLTRKYFTHIKVYDMKKSPVPFPHNSAAKKEVGTHETMLVTYVVCQFQLVEGDHLLHPLLARRRRVGVDVHPLRHLRVCLPSHHPPTPRTNEQIQEHTITFAFH